MAARMRKEREARGWSVTLLAERMTEAGCPMNGSAVWKIERGEPRRRITVDELAALSAVWAIPMDRLVSE